MIHWHGIIRGRGIWHENRAELSPVHRHAQGGGSHSPGPPLGVRRGDHKRGGRDGKRRPGGRGQQKGPVSGHGLFVGAVKDPGAADLPQRQRPVRRGLLAAEAPVGLGLPQERHGPGGPGRLPHHLWGGGCLSGAHRGQVPRPSVHPGALRGHGAHPGPPAAGAGGDPARRRLSRPGHLPAERCRPAGKGGAGPGQGLVPPARRDGAGVGGDGNHGERR